jgi:hypothetical protein
MYRHPVIALALAKQRAAMFEQEAAESALIASMRTEIRGDDSRQRRRRRRRRVVAPRLVG